jgi:hypothetical protein
VAAGRRQFSLVRSQVEGLAVLGGRAALAERAGPQRQSNTARRLEVIATV